MNLKIKKTRCSSLDRTFACQGSILPSDGPREAGGPDAILGRAKHEVLSCIPRGLPAPIAEIAARFGVDFDELERAYAAGRRAWDEVGIYFPSPEVERKLESGVAIGTTDVVQAVIDDGGRLLALRIVDWKTGYGTDLHPYQLKGYALGAVEEFGWPENGVVSVFEIWTTHYQRETDNLDRGQLEAFAGELAQIQEVAAENPDRLEYRAGAHCRWCPHRVGCEVYEAWLRESTTALVAVDHGRAITRGTIGDLYLKAQEVDRAMRKFWAVVDAALDEGPLFLPDGRRVERVESEREKIAAGPAIRSMLEAGLIDCGEDEDELKGDIPKSKIDAWAKRVAPRGKKAALMREVFGVLREAEAIRKVPHRQRKITGGAP